MWSLILAAAAAAIAGPSPIIDMHLHAQSATEFGPPGLVMCSPMPEWPARDSGRPVGEYVGKIFGGTKCARPFASPKSDDEIRDRSLAELRRLNIVAVTSGDAARVAEW